MTRSKKLTRALLGLSVICGGLALSGQASAQLYNYQYQGQCLGVSGGYANTTKAGTPLIVWSCNGSSDQTHFYAYANSTQQRFFTGASAYWKNGSLYIQGYCAGVAAASTQQGAGVIVWNCDISGNSVPDQNWIPEQVPYSLPGHPSSTCFVIKNVNAPGMLLSVAPNGHVITWPGNPSSHNDNQVWCEDPPSGGIIQ